MFNSNNLQINKPLTVKKIFFQNEITEVFRLFWLDCSGVFIFQVIFMALDCEEAGINSKVSA